MDPKIIAQYKKEVYQHTAKVSLWAVPFLFLISLFFFVQDRAIFGERYTILLPMRICFAVACLLYMILYFSVFRKSPKWGYYFYGLALFAMQISGMYCAWVLFTGNPTPMQQFGMVGGVSLQIFGMYLVAGGFRRSLWLLNGVPLAFLLSGLIFFYKISLDEFGLFSNPIGLVALTIVLGIFDEKLRFQEFYSRRLAEERKIQLEIEIEHRREAERKLEVLATTDELTGLFNRRATIRILRKYQALSERLQKDLTLCFVDIDNLKHVNDAYGHQEGDELIKMFSETLVFSMRQSDYLGRLSDAQSHADECNVGRLGGDEFLIVLIGCNKINAEIFVKRIQDNFTKVVETRKKPYPASFSYGLIENNLLEKKSIEALIEEADKAMYQDKQARKERKKESGPEGGSGGAGAK